MTDRRSPEAQAYRHLYKTPAWRNGRLAFLARNPLCERCKTSGLTTAATVVNHRKPHKGDVTLFFSWENWEAVCKPHHDSDIQQEERRGYSTAIGLDGYPQDDRHPANGGRPARTDGLGGISHPAWFRPVFVPITIVCGPIASGKTTYVAQHKGPRDAVYDLDAIALEVTGRPLAMLDSQDRLKCLKVRNDRLSDLMWAKARGSYDHAWLIVSEPHAHKRQWWADTLVNVSIVVMETSADLCCARARAHRGKGDHRSINADAMIRQWWTDYTRRKGDTIVRPEGEVQSPQLGL